MGRRGHGEGAIYRSPDGRWRGAIDLGWVDGKRKRKLVSGRTRPEVVAKLRDAQKAPDSDPRMTVGKWLDHWLDTVVDGRVGSDSTRANYRQLVTLHITPALGKARLMELSAEQVDKFLAAKAREGYSRSTVSRLRTLLTDALRHAERRKLVDRNVGALSVMPKMDAPVERRALPPDEARALLAAASGERLEALLVLGLSCGLRPGELTGLLWEDLDLDSTPPTVTVSGSMKLSPTGELSRGAVKRSTAGQRTIALPQVAVEALRRHSTRQKAERLKAVMWEDQGLVFADEIGRPLRPETVRRVVARVGKKAGLDGVRFTYLLRHSAVSLLVDSGVSIEDVADMLGDRAETLYKHYRHKVRPVADAGLLMQGVLAGSVAAEDAG